MIYLFNKNLRVAVVLSGIVMLMFFCSTAKATDVEEIFSNPANGWILFEDDDGIASGHGGQSFDTEYFFYQLDGDILSIGLQTGFDVEDGRNGERPNNTIYYTGDLALSFDGDISGASGIGYEYAVDFGLKTKDMLGNRISAGNGPTAAKDYAGLYENVVWYNENMNYPEEAPFAMDDGDIVAGALQDNYADLGVNSYYRVVSFDTTMISEAEDGDYVVHAHWTMNCGNDAIHGSFTVEGSTEAVPEPATVALLGIGLAGFAGVAVRRRQKQKEIKRHQA